MTETKPSHLLQSYLVPHPKSVEEADRSRSFPESSDKTSAAAEIPSPNSPTTMKVKSTVFLSNSRKSVSPTSPIRPVQIEADLDGEGAKVWFVTPERLELSHTQEGAAAVTWKEREKEQNMQLYGYEPPFSSRKITGDSQRPKETGSPYNVDG